MRMMNRLLLTLLITGSLCPFLNGQSINKIRYYWQGGSIGNLAGNQRNKLFSDADFHEYARIRDDEFTV